MLEAGRTLSSAQLPNGDTTEDKAGGDSNDGITAAIETIHADDNAARVSLAAYTNVEMCFTKSGEIREVDDSEGDSDKLAHQHKALVPA